MKYAVSIILLLVKADKLKLLFDSKAFLYGIGPFKNVKPESGLIEPKAIKS